MTQFGRHFCQTGGSTTLKRCNKFRYHVLNVCYLDLLTVLCLLFANVNHHQTIMLGICLCFPTTLSKSETICFTTSQVRWMLPKLPTATADPLVFSLGFPRFFGERWFLWCSSNNGISHNQGLIDIYLASLAGVYIPNMFAKIEKIILYSLVKFWDGPCLAQCFVYVGQFCSNMWVVSRFFQPFP